MNQWLQAAIEEAEQGASESGIPTGSVLVYRSQPYFRRSKPVNSGSKPMQLASPA
jgi:tRNA(Arg) A34 adenosine deaminase TadA